MRVERVSPIRSAGAHAAPVPGGIIGAPVSSYCCGMSRTVKLDRLPRRLKRLGIPRPKRSLRLLCRPTPGKS